MTDILVPDSETLATLSEKQAANRAAREHLADLLTEGLESGDAEEVMPEFWERLKAELAAKNRGETIGE